MGERESEFFLFSFSTSLSFSLSLLKHTNTLSRFLPVEVASQGGVALKKRGGGGRGRRKER